ncbi:T9SS type A sorting domain-containing protein [Umezakia ovalisporum]|uniref:T9SS type A sorting domain-containing protein n=1 Tax=Umezakia ovalisporum TaxID=75695 RepID=UPI0039C6D269
MKTPFLSLAISLITISSYCQILSKRINSENQFSLISFKGANRVFFDAFDAKSSYALQPVGRRLGTTSLELTSKLDTFRITEFRPEVLSFGSGIGEKGGNFFFLNKKANPQFPVVRFPSAESGISKHRVPKHKFWDWNITPTGLNGDDYIWNGAYSVETDSSDKFWVLLNRFYSPNGGNVFHPVVMCLDTSGLMVQEYDVPVIEMSVGHQIVQVDANSFGVIGRELGPDTSQSVFWHVRKSPMQLISKTYLGFTAERGPGEWDNTVRVALGPGSRFFIYGVNRSLNQIFYYPLNHIATMRDSIGGRVQKWQITDGWVNYAAFLEDGDLFCQVVTDTGFFLRRYNPITGNILSSQLVKIPDTVNPDWIYVTYRFPIISDSGHFYCGVNLQELSTLNRFTRMYCLPNVGKVWKPWNNPTGLPSSKASLSLHAYPNPTSSRFKLRGYKEEEGLTLRLFNNSGKEVWRGVPSPEGEVDISQLSPGLYHVEALTSSGKRWSTRVVRE